MRILFHLVPLKGYVDGVVILYIVTDTSDNKTATSLTESQGHTINFAPLLASVPIDTFSKDMTSLME